MIFRLQAADAADHAPRDEQGRYANLGGAHRSSIKQFLRWRFGNVPGDPHEERPRLDDIPVVAVNSALRDAAGKRCKAAPGVTWIGHATMLMHLDGLSLLTDPIFTALPRTPRLAAPALLPEQLPRLDAVLISHNHRDHLDRRSIAQIARDVLVIVPVGMGEWMRRARRERVLELDWWDSVECDAGRITFVPAQHWSRRGIGDENKSLWGGFVVETDKHCIYYTGDTGWSEQYAGVVERVAQRFKPRAVMMPIGAYAPRWFMQPQHCEPSEALDAIERLDGARLWPIHWGTFRLSDEPPGEPPAWLAALADKRQLSSQLDIWPIGGTGSLSDL
ncbi:MAG: MBL fold metallo-hydrolase [Myxococcales bacterium]|nr:MBL fold metallo-hydrolase [Myxococcales bacterium]